MHFSNTLAGTDAKAATLCDRCARLLRNQERPGG
jgi:predicted Zn-dependent protease